MAEKSGTSPWVWIGCGCLAAIVLAVAAVGGLGFFGVRQVRQIEQDLRDPDARRAKALEVLGAESLPEGYYPAVSLSVPFLMDMAMLSDRQAEPGAEPQPFGERGLVYLDVFSFGRQRDELREFFDGATTDPEVLRQQNINLDLDEVIARGEAAHPQARVRWVAHTGDVGGAGRAGQSGLVTLLLFECGESDRRLKFGIWYTPDPRLETGDETASLEGTPADGAAVEAFVAPFRPCG
jgi:hypothetical protein